MPTIYLQLQLFSTKDPNEVLEHLVFQCRSKCKQLRAHWRSWSDTERTADPTFRGEGRAFLLMEMTPELRYGNIYYEKMAGSLMCFILDQLIDTTETIGEKTSWRQAFDTVCCDGCYIRNFHSCLGVRHTRRPDGDLDVQLKLYCPSDGFLNM